MRNEVRPSGVAPPDVPLIDAAPPDAAPPDAGPPDAGPPDAAPMDAAAVVAVLMSVDVAGCDRDGLGRVVAWCQQVRGFVDGVDVRVARRARELEAEGRSEAPAEVLSRHGRRSRKDTKAAAERSALCDRLASFEPALGDGSVSTGHLDALVNATRSLDDAAMAELASFEADLLAAARNLPVSMFERDCRHLARLVAGDAAATAHERRRAAANVRRWIDERTGMYHLHAELDPERGATVFTALDAHLATVTQHDGTAGTALDVLAVDAFVDAVSATRTAERPVPELYVVADLQTLTDGLHQRSICELSDGTPLPVATVRRLCCDATIIPIVLGATGEVLDAGRELRVANRAQRRALRAMYRTCAHPDCDIAFDHCRIHHVIAWERFGPTDLDNLLPLCSRHHHLVHEGRWTLTMTPDRTITLTRPDGTLHHHGPTNDRTQPRAVATPTPTPTPTSTSTPTARCRT
jgi:hypothetical protein